MQQRHHPLLSASLGTQREIISYHFGQPSVRQVYIQAALHGDELPGVAVAWYLKKKFLALENADRLNAQITLVPVANPLALGQHWHGSHLGRFDTASGQDFNRQFPALGPALATALPEVLTDEVEHNRQCIRDAINHYFTTHKALTELESQRHTLMRMACQADLMIDLHCDWEAIPHLYTTPQAWRDIEPLARYLGSEVQLIAEVSGGDPFDEACCEPWQYLLRTLGERFPLPQGLKPVTLELRGVRDVSHSQAERDAEAIIRGLMHGGYISGDASALPALAGPAVPLAACEYLSAPHSGVVMHRRETGEWIKPGEVVAEILDPLTDRLTPLTAKHGGLLYARHWARFATAGMLITRLAGREAIREGNLLVP
ncbi:succinylglutamate desuccinylase/aspartoacylase family protein [Erwinia psidii]|uniref:Succinylglutamate desuccinylase/aspartoacylase family protein n=1 Tax=Erwinia psidii TaxID=69224 RepID=A0A3N6S4E0_9GAMM|nr:succinylglutamate desuccinylase/aspartoacylase family protein [Erwinia psidii]MCX8956436.1 succinylglutamate desuccinylase/aspartoacylase family protein [Erwinia psidii]MCX8965827.1 succinylglutamate desuccinylase/aspartoacylase family protein [Erwinia psidii]RQM39767.1 succinylglutamate desuccinylase/aspartoacylase family protein [Erwinia psidii]